MGYLMVRLNSLKETLGDYELCLEVMKDIDFVLIKLLLEAYQDRWKEPLLSHEHNVNGTLNVLWAAVNSGISRVVMAGSSSVYGAKISLPKVEHLTGKPPLALCGNQMYW